jgi:hypothetical protein
MYLQILLFDQCSSPRHQLIPIVVRAMKSFDYRFDNLFGSAQMMRVGMEELCAESGNLHVDCLEYEGKLGLRLSRLLRTLKG